MSYSNIRPKWWQLYLTLPLLVALFVLDARLRISVRGHQSLQIGILLLIYGLVHVWLKSNRSALFEMDRDHYYRTIRVIRVPISQQPDADARWHPMFEVPVSGIKGVLSDRVDLEYSDAATLPSDDVSRILKKE